MNETYWITHFLESWREASQQFAEDDEEDLELNDNLEHELNLTGYRNWTDEEERKFERWLVDFFDVGDVGEYFISIFQLAEYELWSVDERKAFQRLLRTQDANLRNFLKVTLSMGLPEACDMFDDGCRDVHYALIEDGMDWGYLDEFNIVSCLEGRPEIFSVDGMRERLVGYLEKQKATAGYYKDSVYPASSDFFVEESFSFEIEERYGHQLKEVCLWATLIAKDPDVAKYCPDMKGLSGFSRCYLISERPEFEHAFDMSELGNPASDCWTSAGVAKDAMYSRCRYVAGWNRLVSRWAELLNEQELDSGVVECFGVHDGKIDLPTDAERVSLGWLSRACRNAEVKKSLLKDLPHRVFTGTSDGEPNFDIAKSSQSAEGKEGTSKVKVLFSYVCRNYDDDEEESPWSDNLEDFAIIEFTNEQELKSMINTVGIRCYNRGDMESDHMTKLDHYGKNAVEVATEDGKTCALWVILESDPTIDVRAWDWKTMNDLYGRH